MGRDYTDANMTHYYDKETGDVRAEDDTCEKISTPTVVHTVLTIRKATEAEKGTTKDIMYLVLNGSNAVGIITKIKNTHTDIHPWKVFRCEIGKPNTLLGVFYDDADSVKIGPSFDYQNCNIGGRTAAFVFARKVFGGV